MRFQLIRLREVLTRTGLARSTFYQQIQDGLMPTPIKLGKSCVGWLASEIDEVIAMRIRNVSEEGILHHVSEIVARRQEVNADEES